MTKDVWQGIEVYLFSAPMMHKDWHKAEGLGLVYAGYLAEGNDYWDHEMVFCKPENKTRINTIIGRGW
jgi:hypothetical protein